jgi:hypothetical protein
MMKLFGDTDWIGIFHYRDDYHFCDFGDYLKGLWRLVVDDASGLGDQHVDCLFRRQP